MKQRLMLSAALLAILVLVVGSSAALAQTGDTPTTPSQQQVEEPGLVIVAVDPEGPAAEAGVKRGDILLEVDGQAVNRVQELMRQLRAAESGDEVELVVLHGDDERSLTATLAERNGRAYLGLTPYAGSSTMDFTVPAVPALPDESELEGMLSTLTPGAVVREVVDGSPASEAGLQAGDVITAVDDTELDENTTLADVIGGYQPGDTVTLQVMTPGEDEQAREVEVTLGENPDREGVAFLGVQYSSLPFGHFQFRRGMPGGEMAPDGALPFFGDELPFELPDGTNLQGAVVSQVVEDSPASAAGLERGDVVTAVDGEEINGPEALVDAVAAQQPGDTVTLTVQRSGEEESLEIEVVLGPHPDDEEKAYLGVSIGAFQLQLERGGPNQNRQGMQLPFGLDQLPFDLNDLPFDLDQLPFQFELPQQNGTQA